MATNNWNEPNLFLQIKVQRLEQENSDLKAEILKMLMAWGTAQDEIKTLKDQLSSR